MTTPAAAFDRDNEMFGQDLPVTRSAVLEAIQAQLREVQFLENDLGVAKSLLSELQEDLRYAVCDHQDSTGWRCDHCGQFADHGPEFWDWKDSFAVRLADVQDREFASGYYSWLILRIPHVGGYSETGTLSICACL